MNLFHHCRWLARGAVEGTVLWSDVKLYDNRSALSNARREPVLQQIDTTCESTFAHRRTLPCSLYGFGVPMT